MENKYIINFTFFLINKNKKIFSISKIKSIQIWSKTAKCSVFWKLNNFGCLTFRRHNRKENDKEKLNLSTIFFLNILPYTMSKSHN